MPKRKPDESHCTIVRNNVLGCLHCGTEFHLGTDQRGLISIPMFGAQLTGFEDEHRDCRPKLDANGKPRDFVYENSYTHGLSSWINGWDVGRSSRVLWSIAVGRPIEGDTPRDPSDFGRCYRLLKNFDLPRSVLEYARDHVPGWKPLVDHWEELTKLYEEELPSGSAPKLYARMKELRGET